MTTTSIETLESLLAHLRALPRRPHGREGMWGRATEPTPVAATTGGPAGVSCGPLVIVGVDGAGAAGKSTLAGGLAGLRGDVTVVCMDDFRLPRSRQPRHADSIRSHFDWRRLRTQVLEPLREGRAARYQRHDRDRDEPAGWLVVAPRGVVVVEGVASTCTELGHHYDFTVWVDCPRDVRLARALQRDGPGARLMWEKVWMPAEDRYIGSERPHEVADLVVDGSGRVPHDLSREYVRLGL